MWGIELVIGCCAYYLKQACRWVRAHSVHVLVSFIIYFEFSRDTVGYTNKKHCHISICGNVLIVR